MSNQKHHLLFDIARYTGERWGAIVQLRRLDVFDERGKVLQQITFRSSTRKADTSGKRTTRQVPIHPTLGELLATYPVDGHSVWLFPGDGDNHLTLRAADLMLRRAIQRVNLEHKGYCTHSTRRTFITRLWESGVDIHTIQIITGHKDLKSLIRYIEADPKRIERAIALL